MKILTQAQALKAIDIATYELATYIRENKRQNIILGISGGLDSAIVSAIAVRSIGLLKSWNYPCGYFFRFIGIDSDPDDLRKSRVLASTVGFHLEVIDRTDYYMANPDRILNPKNEAEKIFNGNIKCRMRMIILYGLAQLNSGIVLDTDDKSEDDLGFFTVHGDVGDIQIIKCLTKAELRDLAEFLKIPKIIIDAAPGDGLKVTEGNRAEDQLGMNDVKRDYVLASLIHYGLDINGSISQVNDINFLWLIEKLAKEINVPKEKVIKVVSKAINNKFKRLPVPQLLTRKMIGLAEQSSAKFTDRYKPLLTD